MLILIAESKTMKEQELPVTHECFLANTPSSEAQADNIMGRIADMNVEEIALTIKVSPTMAAKIVRMAYEFPNKQTGLRAIDAFTGVVFKNLDYNSFTDAERERVSQHVRIISSLYGWLRPEDIIKPYRFDYTTPLAPDEGTLSSFWRKDVTIQLVRQLQETNETQILNLLPADAAKCVDWKLVKRFAKVWKVDFKEQNGDSVRTPHAGKLKAMRGELLREIIRQGLTNTKSLLTLSNDTLMPLGTPDYPDHIAFCV